jgi:hypothetical protein
VSEKQGEVWWIQTIAGMETTGGIAWWLTCIKCGACIVVTEQDAQATEIHVAWHGLLAMGMAR